MNLLQGDFSQFPVELIKTIVAKLPADDRARLLCSVKSGWKVGSCKAVAILNQLQDVVAAMEHVVDMHRASEKIPVGHRISRVENEVRAKIGQDLWLAWKFLENEHDVTNVLNNFEAVEYLEVYHVYRIPFSILVDRYIKALTVMWEDRQYLEHPTYELLKEYEHYAVYFEF